MENNIYEEMAKAVIAFERVLPDVVDILGKEHPRVVEAVSAMDDLKQELISRGYSTSVN